MTDRLRRNKKQNLSKYVRSAVTINHPLLLLNDLAGNWDVWRPQGISKPETGKKSLGAPYLASKASRERRPF